MLINKYFPARIYFTTWKDDFMNHINLGVGLEITPKSTPKRAAARRKVLKYNLNIYLFERTCSIKWCLKILNVKYSKYEDQDLTNIWRTKQIKGSDQ